MFADLSSIVEAHFASHIKAERGAVDDESGAEMDPNLTGRKKKNYRSSTKIIL